MDNKEEVLRNVTEIFSNKYETLIDQGVIQDYKIEYFDEEKKTFILVSVLPSETSNKINMKFLLTDKGVKLISNKKNNK